MVNKACVEGHCSNCREYVQQII